MAANTKPIDHLDDKREIKDGGTGRSEGDACSTKIDPNAPAGSRNSLGAKSDCNGRPNTDDSVVEAMDEQGPLINTETGKDA